MSETDFEAPASLLPEMTADVSTTDDDKALMGIWNKHNGPEAELKNPAMPDSFARAEAGGDRFQAAAQWMQLPLETRQMEARASREFDDRRKQGEALGMKVESAADHKAIQDMLKGDKPQAPAAIDKDTQATYDTVRAVFPNAKDHREATNSLKGLVEHVTRDPVEGTLAVLKSLPLTPQQRHQVYERMFGDAMQPQQQPAEHYAAEDSGLAAWAAKRGVSLEDQRAMGDIVSEPTWRDIAGESLDSTLDRAHKALQRSRARNGANSREGRLNRDLDATLRATAADIYRP